MTKDRFALLVDKTVRITDMLGVVIVLAMMVHVSADVLVKYLGFPPLTGTTEIVSYWYMPVIAFLPLAAVERHNGHIRADILDQFGAPWMAKAGEIVAYIVSAGFFAIFAHAGWVAAEEKRAVGAFVMGTDHVLIWPTYYMVPVGCALMALMVLIRLLGLIALPAREPMAEGAHP